VQLCVTLCRALKDKELEARLGKRRLQQWYVSYIELLHRQQLWSPASTVMARASDEGIRRLNQLHTVFNACCSGCGKDTSSSIPLEILRVRLKTQQELAAEKERMEREKEERKKLQQPGGISNDDKQDDDEVILASAYAPLPSEYSDDEDADGDDDASLEELDESRDDADDFEEGAEGAADGPVSAAKEAKERKQREQLLLLQGLEESGVAAVAAAVAAEAEAAGNSSSGGSKGKKGRNGRADLGPRPLFAVDDKGVIVRLRPIAPESKRGAADTATEDDSSSSWLDEETKKKRQKEKEDEEKAKKQQQAQQPPPGEGSGGAGNKAPGLPLLQPGNGELQAVASVSCTGCKEPIATCSICLQPVRGPFSWCQGCQHGGHLTCLFEWFSSYSSLCPTGCGHVCNLKSSNNNSSK
jgi:Zinc-ribbon, C4HC2 type